jgi:hypothetical protein
VRGRTAPQQGIGYAHAAERPRSRTQAQVVEVGVSEGEKWGYSRIAEMAAVRPKQNENENSGLAGVC